MEEILVRYFQGTCSPEEAKEARAFKGSFPIEYELLEKLWKNRDQIELHEYNTALAWTKVWGEINKVPNKKTVPLHLHVIRWAAVIAIFVTATLLIFQNRVDNLVISGADNREPIKLVDGTMVWLNRNTTLSYPKEFTSDQRKVSLEGEAYFDVFKDPNRSFIIESVQAEIKVLGTSFNVKSSDSTAIISVTSGLVEVKAKQSNLSDTFSRGEEALVVNAKITKQRLSPNFQSWRTGEFSFENTPIQKVIQDLTHYYPEGLSYEVKTSNCRLTATIKNMSLSEVKELLESVCDLESI
ncbi:MAG: FecR domain-containing protein [Bacteroidota bacterium]